MKTLNFYANGVSNRFVDDDAHEDEASILDHVTPNDLFLFRNGNWWVPCNGDEPMTVRHRYLKNVEVNLWLDKCWLCDWGTVCSDSPYWEDPEDEE